MEAVVLEGLNEVRRYSKAIHGKNFEKLAEKFVAKHSTESVPLRIEIQEGKEVSNVLLVGISLLYRLKNLKAL